MATPVQARLVAVERLDGRLELSADVRRQRFSDSQDDSRRFDRDRFSEQVGIRTEGSLLGEGLAHFSLAGSFGLRQDRLEATESGNESDVGTLLQYDARLNLLSGKPVTLALFGNQHRDDGSQAFGTDTDTFGNVYGATLRAGAPFFPSSLTWQRMETRVKSQYGGGSTLRQDVREVVELRGQRFGEHLQLTLSGRHEDVEDKSNPPVGDYQIDEGAALLGLHWGARRNMSLRTTARYFQRQGNFDYRSASGGASFGWDVSERFIARVDGGVTHFESDGAKTTTWNGTASARHRLFDSLTTTLRAFGDQSNQDDGRREVYGADLDLAYRKELFWQSRLQVDLGARYRVEDNDFDDDQDRVFGEVLALADVVDNFLEHDFVLAESIEVFDGIGGVQLTLGIDYEVEQTGSLTSINLLPGGSLVVGDTVVVNYAYRIDPQSKTATTDFRAGVGWERAWFRIRYDHDQSHERLVSGARPSVLRDSEQDSVRVQLRTRLRELSLRADGLALRERSETTDYDELRFTQSLSWKPWTSVSVNLTLLQGLRLFMKPSRDSETLSARGSLSWRIARGHHLRAYAMLRSLEDSVSDDQRDLEFGLRGSFDFFKLDAIPSLTWTRRARGDSKSTDLRGGLLLRRRF